jgi:hypothetical protein
MQATHWAYQYFVQKGKDAEGHLLYRCTLPDDSRHDRLCDAPLAFYSVASLTQHLKLKKHTATWAAHTTSSNSSTASSSAAGSGASGKKRSLTDMFARVAPATSSPSAAAAAAAVGQMVPMELDDAQSISDTITSVSVASPPPTVPARRATKQQKMTEHVDSPLAPLNAILMMLVMNCWPLSAIEDPYLRQAFSRTAKAGHGLVLPSRKTLRKMLTSKYTAMKGELVTRLQKLRTPVSLVLDGWTDVNHNKVTNVLLVAQGKSYYWCSISNKSERNTATWLAAALSPVIRSIEEQGIAVISFVADNEEVMSATHRRLEPEFAPLLRIPCAAHTLQLVVKKIMLASPFKQLVEEYIEMLNHFSGSKQLRLALDKAQPSDNMARRLIRPCDTRWSYTLFSIDRSIKLQKYIGAAQFLHGLPPKEAHFWQQLAEIAAILRPFADATDVLQRDNAVLSDVAEQFSTLVLHTCDIEKTHPSIGAIIHGCIRAQWFSHHVHSAATVACCFLSRKRGFEKLITREDNSKAQRFIVEWGTKYLNHYQPFAFSDGDIGQILDDQLVAFASNSGPIFEPVNFHRRLSSLGALASWISMLDAAPELAHVAVALVGICASEAAVERSFSLQDRIHSKTRNRSAEDLVEAQMFIKFNSPVLHSDFLPTIHREDPKPAEMACEDEDAPPIVLKYLLDPPPPIIAIAGAAAAVADSEAAPVDAEEKAEVNGVDEDDLVQEDEDAESIARAIIAAEPPATHEQEDTFLRDFIRDFKIKPNAKGRVIIISDLVNQLSNDVERYRPKIKSQLTDLQKRLVTMARA